MVFTKKHLREIADTNAMKETVACCCEHLDAVKTGWESNNASVELALKERLTEVLVYVEEDDLAITTSNADFVVSNCINLLNTLSADTLAKNEHLVFDLIRTEVSRGATNEHELFVGLGESDALVVSDHRTCLHDFIGALAKDWVELP